NRSGQRTYRRRDVEMALRIKQLLYDEQYTIAGAKKKLANDSRSVSRDVEAPVAPRPPVRSLQPPPSLAARFGASASAAEVPKLTSEQRGTLKEVAQELREILDLLANGDAELKPGTGKRAK